MTADDFTEAARAEAEALVDDIIRWDDTIATDGPCDGTWDSLAAYLAGRGWARPRSAAQEPTDAESIARKKLGDDAVDRLAAHFGVTQEPTDGERAVRALHQRAWHGELDYCRRCVDVEGAIWPCPTIRALDSARRDEEKRDG